jgi:hypothetical protein
VSGFRSRRGSFAACDRVDSAVLRTIGGHIGTGVLVIAALGVIGLPVTARSYRSLSVRGMKSRVQRARTQLHELLSGHPRQDPPHRRRRARRPVRLHAGIAGAGRR